MRLCFFYDSAKNRHCRERENTFFDAYDLDFVMNMFLTVFVYARLETLHSQFNFTCQVGVAVIVTYHPVTFYQAMN